MSNSAEADARTVEVRPARIWQPTDLLHPIAPEGGFLATPWRVASSKDFDPHGFSTPVIDLKAPPPPSEDAPDAQAAQDGTDLAPEATADAPAAPVEHPIDAQALEDARAQGHAQGVAETREAMQAEMAQALQEALGEDGALLDKLRSALDDLQQSPNTFFEPLKRLALHLAEQLVLAELQIDGSAIERLVQRCVDELAQHDESMVLIELHPDDVTRLQSMRERTGLNEGSALRVQANDSLAPASVRASANDAVVEDLIGDRLSALARGLHIDEKRFAAQSAFSPNRLAADRLPSSGVEDVRPRMSASEAASADAAYDTVAAIDAIVQGEADDV
jgi:flagellar biosynthesis/type III secretory pathway protein FliH